MIKSLLPPAPCKQCVYWFRVIVGSTRPWHQEYPVCPRCGIAQWHILDELNERLYGITRPAIAAESPPLPNRIPVERTGGESALATLLRLYDSKKPHIRLRAAKALIRKPDAPLTTLLDILDHLSHFGLGAKTEQALLKRQGDELLSAMIARLSSADDFIREVACHVLGNLNNRAATPHLLRMLDDPYMMVHRQAAFAVAQLADRSAITELRRQLAARRNDDINVVMAIECAITVLTTEGAAADD